MSEPYEEILEGRRILRPPPAVRHELICSRLHDCVHASVADFTSTRLLARRSQVQLSPTTTVRPDLALVAAATGKIWLAAEIVGSEDHRVDTVVKKLIYEEMKLARLWMVDPRYASEYGLVKSLPEFQPAIADWFGAAA